MSNLIPRSVKKIWNEGNKQGIILLSLLLQTVLVLLAPLRKGTGNKLITSLIWSAYLLADLAADFGVGLIADSARGTPSKQPAEKKNNDILAFWASFLLLHLGGPDTITALSLEDNELWLRQFFGLIFQVAVVVYIFLQTLPRNELFIPTVLILIAGIIKYFERIRALHLASLAKFRDSMLGKPNPGPNYAKFMETCAFDIQANTPINISMVPEAASRYMDPGNNAERLDCLEVVQNAYQLFNHSKGLIVDLLSSFRDLFKSRASFTMNYSSENAMRIIEVELNFIYDVLYTKIGVIHTALGLFLRLVSFGSVVAALSVFSFQVEKHGLKELDVGVTYTLFLGAIALDMIAFFMLVFSDQTFVALMNGMNESSNWAFFASRNRVNNESRFGKIRSRIATTLSWFLHLKDPQWQESHSHRPDSGIKHQVLATHFFFRRWSGSVSGHSLIRYWLKARPRRVHNVKTCLHKLACCKKVGIDKIFPNIANFTNKAIQFLHIYKILGHSNYIIKKLVALLGIAGIVEDISIYLSLSHEPFTKELWMLIFDEIKRKSLSAGRSPELSKRICSAKGDWILQEWSRDAVTVRVQVYTNLAYDESILLWHLATELLYYTTEEGADEKTYNARDFSKLLSDYILYLLVSKPETMDAVEVIAKIRLQDTSAEAIRFCNERGIKSNEVKKACESILKVDTSWPPSYVKGDKSKSVLFDASMLAKELQKLEEEKKWELVSKVWVELLSYAACHCKPRIHARQVGDGGELITFVWLLMAHFGLVEQFEDNKPDTTVWVQD